MEVISSIMRKQTMDMEIETFTLRNSDLRLRFQESMDEPDNHRYVIYDGAVNPERYLASPIKIAWMLKEPYEEEDGTGGGWSFTDAFDKEDLYNHTFKQPHKATWHPIIYASYGITHGFQRWDDMPYISNSPNLCDVVRSIAIVNAQKLPSLGGAKTDFAHIQHSYGQHQVLLHEQIDLIQPDILIFASTFSLYRDALGLTDFVPMKKKSIDYYFKDGKLYVDAYHPAQLAHKRPVYVDDIIEAVEEWHSHLSKQPTDV